MGHDISGYRVDDTEQRDEIAYLRRSAFNPLKITIYNALDCHEMNGGCSGIGEVRKFAQTEIVDALSRIPDGDEYEPERTFLRDCIASGEAGVVIAFY